MAVRQSITIDPVTAGAVARLAEKGAEWYRQNGIVLPADLLEAVDALRVAGGYSAKVPPGMGAEQASGMMSAMDSSTAATVLRVTPRRVRAMCAAGVLDAKRTAAGWQIETGSVAKRMS